MRLGLRHGRAFAACRCAIMMCCAATWAVQAAASRSARSPAVRRGCCALALSRVMRSACARIQPDQLARALFSLCAVMKLTRTRDGRLARCIAALPAHVGTVWLCARTRRLRLQPPQRRTRAAEAAHDPGTAAATRGRGRKRPRTDAEALEGAVAHQSRSGREEACTSGDGVDAIVIVIDE
jgi:hypothetical protein